MDFGDVSKVASRKRLNVDAEKLREKVSRETAKIIKLKVAQDTAYWDLKEKLQQVEGNHERLQQNMVEVQMQHEAISGQYQDELRLRPQTLNKMSSTREICDVLEEYSERLKETLSRCKRDQAALCEAYQRSGRGVRDAQLRRERADHEHTQLVQRLEEKLKLTSEHHSQLLQYFTSTKQQAESDLNEAKVKLASVQQQKDELHTAAGDLRRQLDLKQHELQKKEEAISALQQDMKQLLQEFKAQAGDMKNTLHKQERDINETTEANEALKKALANQEQFAQGVCAQNSQLQDKLLGLEEEQKAADKAMKELDTMFQLANSELDNLKINHQLLGEQKQELEKTLKDKDDLLANLKSEIENFKRDLTSLETEKNQTASELSKAKDECDSQAARVQDLEAAKQGLLAKRNELEAELADQKATSTQKLESLSAIVKQKDKELDDNADTIARLMGDVRAACDARARVEMQLQRLRGDMEVEREAAKEKERKVAKQVEQLEGNVRSKDDEISKQISIILEIRSEKERLQDKIESMQNTIDNIQKELTGRAAPLHRAPPEHEHDDNAVMHAPTKSRETSPKLPTPGGFAAPRAEPKQLDSMLYSLFSDGSVDGDTLDPSEVNRRFEALSRGERVSPLPLGSLKRRAGVPATQGGLKYKPSNIDHISLSQVKNDLKNKEKSFFKNKRLDTKFRKPK